MAGSGEFGTINPQEELEEFIRESYLRIFLSDERIEELARTDYCLGLNNDLDEDVQALYFDAKYPAVRQYVDPVEREMFS